VPPTVKHAVRRLSRRVGYDIVAFRTGLAEQQARLVVDQQIDLLVDVGANEGQYAQRMRDLGYRGDLLSLEPGSAAFSRLEHNARGDARWSQVRTAVGAEAGVVTLNVSANSVSSSTLGMLPRHADADPGSQYDSSEDVPCATLDDLLQTSPARNVWLKIDTQGTELAVLRGATEVLGRTRVLQTELSLADLYKGQSTPQEVLELLLPLGFRVCALEPGFQDPATGDLLQCDVILRRP
jgi:FkbM family methyltransferase